MNSPIQGTAADLIKRAMIAVDAALEARGLQSRLILQVHDELIVEAPDAEVPAVAALLERCMRSAGALRVALEVDVHAGRNWLDMDLVDAAAEGGVSA
jgi:DNA polymerase-1